MSGRRWRSGRALQAKPAPATRSRMRTTLHRAARPPPVHAQGPRLAPLAAGSYDPCTVGGRMRVFADFDPPQTFALRADEILGNERQTGGDLGRALQGSQQRVTRSSRMCRRLAHGKAAEVGLRDPYPTWPTPLSRASQIARTQVDRPPTWTRPPTWGVVNLQLDRHSNFPI